MKIETKEIYKCEYCNKLYQMKNACIKHEISCRKRPDYLRACHTCKHLKKVTETIWSGVGDEYGNETERVVSVLFCDKIDSFIHPPSVAAKGNAFEMDKPNVEMLKKCKLHKPDDYSSFMNDDFFEH